MKFNKEEMLSIVDELAGNTKIELLHIDVGTRDSQVLLGKMQSYEFAKDTIDKKGEESFDVLSKAKDSYKKIFDATNDFGEGYCRGLEVVLSVIKDRSAAYPVTRPDASKIVTTKLNPEHITVKLGDECVKESLKDLPSGYYLFDMRNFGKKLKSFVYFDSWCQTVTDGKVSLQIEDPKIEVYSAEPAVLIKVDTLRSITDKIHELANRLASTRKEVKSLLDEADNTDGANLQQGLA